jgi:hypothetical protein
VLSFVIAKKTGDGEVVARTFDATSSPVSEILTRRGKAVAEQGVKYSFIMPVVLSEKIHRACELHHLKASYLFRQLLMGGIDSWLGTQPPRVIPGPPEEPGEAPIQVDHRIRPALRLACELWGMTESVFLSMVLRDNLAAYIKQGKVKRDELAPLLAELEAVRERSDPGDDTAHE